MKSAIAPRAMSNVIRAPIAEISVAMTVALPRDSRFGTFSKVPD
jgi:hypothetical protein